MLTNKQQPNFLICWKSERTSWIFHPQPHFMVNSVMDNSKSKPLAYVKCTQRLRTVSGRNKNLAMFLVQV